MSVREEERTEKEAKKGVVSASTKHDLIDLSHSFPSSERSLYLSLLYLSVTLPDLLSVPTVSAGGGI